MQLPGKIGIPIRLLLVRYPNLSSVTGVVNGAPKSFQSGNSSFKAIGSTTAPDKI